MREKTERHQNGLAQTSRSKTAKCRDGVIHGWTNPVTPIRRQNPATSDHGQYSLAVFRATALPNIASVDR